MHRGYVNERIRLSTSCSTLPLTVPTWCRWRSEHKSYALYYPVSEPISAAIGSDVARDVTEPTSACPCRHPASTRPSPHRTGWIHQFLNTARPRSSTPVKSASSPLTRSPLRRAWPHVNRLIVAASSTRWPLTGAVDPRRVDAAQYAGGRQGSRQRRTWSSGLWRITCRPWRKDAGPSYTQATNRRQELGHIAAEDWPQSTRYPAHITGQMPPYPNEPGRWLNVAYIFTQFSYTHLLAGWTSWWRQGCAS